MNAFIRIARAAALEAGRLLKDNIYGARDISYKGTINLVTEMDKRSERVIVDIIHGAFPGHRIIAEEDTRVENASDYCWFIDPLDGTTNYAHGYPNFAVSIGLEYDGEIISAAVYDPMRDEMFTAQKGEGAYLNERSIAVSGVDELIRGLLATGFPYDRAESRENNLNYFNALIMAAQEVRRSGSAALDLCSVAAGRLDGYWELKLQPWDVAAGGRVSDFSGMRFSIRDKEILVSNGLLHERIRNVLAVVRQGGSDRKTGNDR